MSGLVVDAAGNPVEARVHLVFEHGSMGGKSFEDGGFEFNRAPDKECVVTAQTDQGGFAYLAGVVPTQRELRLSLQKGATVWIDIHGRPTARFAAFYGEVRLADFTVREGERAGLKLPAKDIRVMLYSGDKVFVDRHLTLSAGAVEGIEADLPSW